MSWKETRTVDERIRFIVAVAEGQESVAAVCRQFGISRRIGYKWIGRYEQEGPAGLLEQSRAPHHPPRLAEVVEEAILAARSEHPTWGPKKLLVVLERQGIELPARSTVAAVLKRHGLAVPQKRRRRVPVHEQPFAGCRGPNATWCADFKGWFCTGDGQRCEPLTISDAFSRYLLRCQGVKQTGYEGVRPLFEAVFREYGLPWTIRTDNGPPFASRAIAGLSELSLWWGEAGDPSGADPARLSAAEWAS